MLVCWEWLSQYVQLTASPAEMASRFAMSGLNHESTDQVGSDTILDLEVTSNRGDCLGHIGVAREAAVLLGKPLSIPAASPRSNAATAASRIQVENQFKSACPNYTARVIRGIQVGPSPEWLARRLAAVGIASINNVVDVTNYVMMECGQPLHAFDLKHIDGGRIIIRPASKNEKLVAIDHRTYALDPQMVVIADHKRAVALGGVMGGADSEVSESTVDLLIEAASFDPLPIRRAARLLKLHSPSSFRFERRPDPSGLDWASRRCCELILEIAGGELLSGVVSDGSEPPPRDPIVLRRPQVSRVLGIDIAAAEVDSILTALGCELLETGADRVKLVPPTWRGDLTREIDLIEEVARIHGYEQIPENVHVPLQVAPTRPKDIALRRVRHALSAYGIDEAMTPSVVGDRLEEAGSVWSDGAPLATQTPLLVGAKLLRRSLLPSLLAARHTNQTQSIRNAQLYEVATIYLPGQNVSSLPSEQSTLGLVTGGELRFVRGVVEEVIAQVVNANAAVHWQPADHAMFETGSLLRIVLEDATLGYVGLVSRRVQAAFSLEGPVAAAEINIDGLTAHLEEVRRADPVSAYPAISRDLNFIVEEQLTWAALSTLCVEQGGELLQEVQYQETYRDTKKDGPGKKRLLLTLRFRSLDRTLTSGEVDASVQSIVAACSQQFAAQLLS